MSARDNMNARQFNLPVKKVGRLISGDYGGTMDEALRDRYTANDIDTDNTRTHLQPGTGEYASLREDVAQHGIQTPLTVDHYEGGTVVNGHHRFYEAQAQGIQRVPVTGVTRKEIAVRTAKYTPPDGHENSALSENLRQKALRFGAGQHG